MLLNLLNSALDIRWYILKIKIPATLCGICLHGIYLRQRTIQVFPRRLLTHFESRIKCFSNIYLFNFCIFLVINRKEGNYLLLSGSISHCHCTHITHNFFVCFCPFWDRVLLRGSGWPWTHFVAEVGLELLAILSLPPKCWCDRCAPPSLPYLYISHLDLFYFPSLPLHLPPSPDLLPIATKSILPY